MNDEYRIIGIDQKNDLKEPPIVGGTPNEVFFVGLHERKRSPGASDDFLCL